MPANQWRNRQRSTRFHYATNDTKIYSSEKIDMTLITSQGAHVFSDNTRVTLIILLSFIGILFLVVLGTRRWSRDLKKPKVKREGSQTNNILLEFLRSIMDGNVRHEQDENKILKKK